MPSPLRALIVDDSALYRQMIRNVLERIGGVQVVGTAADGEEAVLKAREFIPDVVTLDVTMPRMDGIEVLREFRRAGIRSRVIMISSLTRDGAPATVEALLEGAFDYVLKPVELDAHVARDRLARELGAIVTGIMERSSTPATPPRPVASRPYAPAYDAIAIGASTGGPEILRRMVSLLATPLAVPVAVVQHMPPVFTATLAKRLDELSTAARVVETIDGMPFERGRIHVAAGGCHLRTQRIQGVVKTADDGGAPGVPSRSESVVCRNDSSSPPKLGCRPSVDVLLESMVATYGGRLLAVILTGMGHDGADGCAAVRAAGGTVVAQVAGECAVYGMPKAVIERGLADAVMSVTEIAALLSAGRALR